MTCGGTTIHPPWHHLPGFLVRAAGFNRGSEARLGRSRFPATVFRPLGTLLLLPPPSPFLLDNWSLFGQILIIHILQIHRLLPLLPLLRFAIAYPHHLMRIQTASRPSHSNRILLLDLTGVVDLRSFCGSTSEDKDSSSGNRRRRKHDTFLFELLEPLEILALLVVLESVGEFFVDFDLGEIFVS
ncbi:uncharacterized protein A4U43_C01F2610 [Asparagus officinalis]|uniref:Uncharacterized protein n=1 Tax=Asparagus officinalis TaxID=4686 RepID=A0A5P1FLR1_ASPOF|nr:uncharacterized protein A4U43_C01F2610 [Asparagus officinalis]